MIEAVPEDQSRKEHQKTKMPSQDSRTYIAIDLKSFFASVECVKRGLDPLTTNLVVADASRQKCRLNIIWESSMGKIAG